MGESVSEYASTAVGSVSRGTRRPPTSIDSAASGTWISSVAASGGQASAVRERGALALHPGAERYYREKGWLR
jgi:hypothetical protein